MGQISVACNSVDEMKKFYEAGADILIFSLPFFSVRPFGVLTIDELKEAKQIADQFQKQIAVNMTRFFVEHELNDLVEMMKQLKELKIDYIYFSDCAVLQVAIELDMVDHLIYNPETLITNAADAQLYLDQGLYAITLAKEITKDEIVQLTGKIKGRCEVIVFGRLNMMHSKRNLLSSYMEFLKKDEPVKDRHDLYLMEENRDEHMPILEDETGTHVFCGWTLCAFKELLDLNADIVRLEGLFLESEELVEAVKATKAILNKERSGEECFEWFKNQYPLQNITNGYMEKKTSLKKV